MDKLLKFFLSKDSYPSKPDAVKHYETHISHVFLVGDFVYKIKKPVKFDFLDFSTLRKRLYFCKREVRLNSFLAKDCYFGVKRIYENDGKLSFKKTKGSKVYEYAVLIKRFDESLILSNLINEGELLTDKIAELAKIISNFHRKVPVFKGPYYGGYSAVKRDNDENLQEIKSFVGITLQQKSFETIKFYTENFLLEHRKTFKKRKSLGFIREIHGDLHTKHIVLSKPVVIFDCIEFNDRFRIDDVLTDIAFLLMDLEFLGRFDLSSLLYDIYFKINDRFKNDDLLKFFKVYRAVVRGKIESFTANGTEEKETRLKALKRAKDYFALACNYITNDKAFNPLIFMGLSGSGKSSVAKQFSQNMLILRSDEIRKKMAGSTKVGGKKFAVDKGIYAPEMTEKTYKALLEHTVRAATEGKRVVVDATFLKRWQRSLFLENAKKGGLNPLFIYFTAPDDLLLKRVAQRRRERKDLSDADESVLKHQLQTFEYPDELPSFRLMKLKNTGALKAVTKNIEVLLQ
ncbi:MAG: bifunctional aminoglycoside phosphotransferase/ATP-binding protein [bacterium]